MSSIGVLTLLQLGVEKYEYDLNTNDKRKNR